MNKLIVSCIFLFIGFTAQSQTTQKMETALVNKVYNLKTNASVLSVSTDLLISGNDPENIAIRNLLNAEPDKNELKGKRIAIVVTDGVEEIELTYVYKILTDRGAKLDIVSPKKPTYPAKFAATVPEVRATHITTVHWMENGGLIKIDRFIDDVRANEYDAVFIPGGAWNPDGLRGDQKVIDFVKDADAQKKIIASLCHGPQVLINAGIVKDRSVTSWWSMMIDLTNAGAKVTDQSVVIDGNLITSRGPIDLADFTKAIISALK